MSLPQFRFDEKMERVWFAHYCPQWRGRVTEDDLLGGYLPTAKWTVTQKEPLTVTPSIHCAEPEGCGLHGWIRDGKWVSA